jgi:peptidoglycan lytic transglycosylase B
MANQIRKPIDLSNLIKTRFKIIIVCITFLGLWGNAFGESNAQLFKTLQKQLIQDGFSKEDISSLYQHKKAIFNDKGVSLFFMHRESTLNYNQFSAKKNISKAKKYMNTHKAALEQAEKETGVDPQVITAIILVETKFGKYIGRQNIFTTLSTMAAPSDPVVLEALWDKIPPKKRLERKAYEKKAQRKSKWAYKELKAFIKYTQREKMPPHDIKGSYAGALGIAQFMPTSILAYARDGNKDSRIDLFDHADAIASIGNYLKEFGWYPNINKKEAYKVVMHYNKSSYYANTVLKVAALLKG